jgi:hypothetical protein
LYCESNIFDDCLVCDGDNSQCNEPIAFDQNIDIDEDEFITIQLKAYDPNGDLLSYQITQNPSNGSISGDGNVYLYVPDNEPLLGFCVI